MAFIFTSTLFKFYLILVLASFTTINGIFSEQYAVTKENSFSPTKMTHHHSYFHDIVSGKHPTVETIAGSINKFGMTVVIDDPLTEGTKHGSKVVGRAQGFYALSSPRDSGFLMVINFAFSEGKYNGSSLSIPGRNRVLDKVREMPIVGGNGVFRLARGYLLAKTVRYNLKSGNAVVEYNVFVPMPNVFPISST